MSNFLGITAHFIDATWKLCGFVLAADSFLEKHTACNIAKAYDDVIEKFKLTSKVTKVVSDNASSMVKAFQILQPDLFWIKLSVKLMRMTTNCCLQVLYLNMIL